MWPEGEDEDEEEDEEEDEDTTPSSRRQLEFGILMGLGGLLLSRDLVFGDVPHKREEWCRSSSNKVPSAAGPI